MLNKTGYTQHLSNLLMLSFLFLKRFHAEALIRPDPYDFSSSRMNPLYRHYAKTPIQQCVSNFSL